MPHPPAENQTSPRPLRTVLLATDNKNSILAELAGGQPNPIAYSAYGQQSAQREVATHLGFNGELRETQIGWYLLGNGYRAYNPKLMRFHSPDSWSPFDSGGLNAYMYCVGDPVNFSDPTGHSIFGVIRDFYSRNISFIGASQASINTRHQRSITTGIKMQEAMHALKQAGGSPSPAAASGQSLAVNAIGGLMLGAPGPRGNNNPAIGNIGSTTARHHGGYETAAQIGVLGGAAAQGERALAQSTSQGPYMRAGVSNLSNRTQGMHRDSRVQSVTTSRESVRIDGDANGVHPSPNLGTQRQAFDTGLADARRLAFYAALDLRVRELRQDGVSHANIVITLRAEGESIRQQSNSWLT